MLNPTILVEHWYLIVFVEKLVCLQSLTMIYKKGLFLLIVAIGHKRRAIITVIFCADINKFKDGLRCLEQAKESGTRIVWERTSN